MRHTWHADQETTVLLHFCHHLPTDFFHIPIWMGGLGFLSISSPLTVSQQKAPLVRFLSQQLMTRSGLLGRAAAACSRAPAPICPPRPHRQRPAPGQAQNCQNSSAGEWRTQCQVSSTNYQLQLPSVTFINMCFIEGGLFWRLCHLVRRGDERPLCFLSEQPQAYRTGRLGLCEPRQRLCTNKPWKAWITL